MAWVAVAWPIWLGLARYNLASYDLAHYALARYGSVRYGLGRYGLALDGDRRCGLGRFGLALMTLFGVHATVWFQMLWLCCATGVLSCIMLCHAMSCRDVSYHVSACPMLSCRVMACHVMLMSCYAIR